MHQVSELAVVQQRAVILQEVRVFGCLRKYVAAAAYIAPQRHD